MWKKMLFIAASLVMFVACEPVTEEFKELSDSISVETNLLESIVEVGLDAVQNLGQELGNELVSNLLPDSIEQVGAIELEEVSLVPAKVVRHIDGDTLIATIADYYQHSSGEVLEGGVELRVRYLMVDCPEITRGKDEPFGKEALEFVANAAAPGEYIYLEFDKGLYDPYDRVLAYIYLENGSMLNEMLLEEGLAHVVVYQPNNKYEDRFREIEKRAKENKVGIWSVN